MTDEIKINTSFTRNGFQPIALAWNSSFIDLVESNTGMEVRIDMTQTQLKELGLLPAYDEDGASQKSALDCVTTPGSNFNDSSSFLSALPYFSNLGFSNNKKELGLIQDGSNQLDWNPPEFVSHKTFLQSAGAEIVSIKTCGKITKGLLMNQAGLFYYSGHGFSGSSWSDGPGFLINGLESACGRDIGSYWSADLDAVVLAGCSIVNINNMVANESPSYYPPLIGPNVGYYPGLYMNQLGPEFILGYGHAAPSDSQNSASIATNFCQLYDASPRDPISAWKQANNNSNGRNATAIQKNTKYCYFKRIKLGGVTVGFSWEEVPYSQFDN